MQDRAEDAPAVAAAPHGDDAAPDRRSHLAQPATWSARLGAGFVGALEWLNARASKVGDEPVFDNARFPWVDEVERDWPSIRSDLDRVLERRSQLPSFHEVAADVGRISQDDQWKTYFLYGLGRPMAKNCAFCPDTARILERIPGLVTAFFSILAPGKRIPLHRGPFNGVLRYHLGLRVPRERERCWIRIGGERRTWTEGESLVFDDSFNHEVHNDTDEYRAILFVDFLRPLHFPVGLLNRGLIGALRFAPGLRRSKAWHETWETEFHDG